jgi:hypothetical protein
MARANWLRRYLVHPLKVGAPASGERERRAAAVVLVGHAAQQPGGYGLARLARSHWLSRRGCRT